MRSESLGATVARTEVDVTCDQGLVGPAVTEGRALIEGEAVTAVWEGWGASDAEAEQPRSARVAMRVQTGGRGQNPRVTANSEYSTDDQRLPGERAPPRAQGSSTR